MRWRLILTTNNNQNIVDNYLYYRTRSEMRRAAKFYRENEDNVLRTLQQDMNKM